MKKLVGVFLPAFFTAAATMTAAAQELVIQVETPDKIQPKVVQMLQEEIQERTGLELAVVDTAPSRGTVLALSVYGNSAPPEGVELPEHAEAFAILTNQENSLTTIRLIGRSSRGVLFAVGRLLREAQMNPGSFKFDHPAISTAPAYAFRGHQMGYRNTANSYDLWDVDRYEQYFRDLVVFGTNGVELIHDPAKEFTEAAEYEQARHIRDTALMAYSQWEMNVKLAKLLQEYGLDVWIWEPLSGDVNIPEIGEAELKMRREFYAEVPHIDHVFVPGGDPGRTHPDTLMPWLEKHAAILHERFPEAGLWVSNQDFTPEENERFFGFIQKNNPTWLAGVAYGPGAELSVQEVRELLPKQYPIRHYPDITHNVRCQFPVPGLDRILAQTIDREGINPRPTQMAGLFNVISPPTNGFVSYSDGCHDDLNKAIFSALGWEPDAQLEDLVRDYARVHFGEAHADTAAKGLYALEEVFKQPFAENKALDKTLALWQQMAGDSPELTNNWRYQMYLFRALFDAYIGARLPEEQKVEQAAYDALRDAPKVGAAKAIERAQKALMQADLTLVRPELRLQLEELGLALFKSIGFQFSIDPPYRARNPERGALLDKVDRPLNDRPWLEAQFTRTLAEKDAGAQLQAIAELVNWEDPGPGGFYDDLGNVRKQPHLIRQTEWKDDPGFDHGPFEAHFRQMDNSTRQINPVKLSWTDQIETPPRTPVLLRYSDLDPQAAYKVRATYFGRYGAVMRLVADGTHEISAEQGISDPVWPVEFDIPKEATEDGQLELAWTLVRNRGCQLAEVWLIKK